MKKQNLTIVTYPLVMVFFLLLLFVSTVEYAQGITCENLGVEGICVDLEFGLTNEDLKTSSEYDFSEPFPEGLYLALEKVTIINKPGIVGESENTSNLSFTIDAHPIGAEKISIAKITVPPLKPNDIYEITYSYTGTNRFYESKLNGKPKPSEDNPHFHRIKLTTDGWWQIDVELYPLNWSGITSFGYTPIINGEQQNYFFKVYSDYEITELETTKSDLLVSRASLVVIVTVGLATLYLTNKQSKSIKKITEELREVTDELKGGMCLAT
jgi:hypothetical protein